jgi:hypothetical protein
MARASITLELASCADRQFPEPPEIRVLADQQTGKGIMLKNRRTFLWAVSTAVPILTMGIAQLPDQNPKSPMPTFTPEDPAKPDTAVKAPSKARLEANDKDIKKKVEKLFQLATELKEQVEKTDSSQVLSLALLKKAEEIEKLAKEIKNRSAG